MTGKGAAHQTTNEQRDKTPRRAARSAPPGLFLYAANIPTPTRAYKFLESPEPTRVSCPPDRLVFAVGGHGTGNAAQRDISPTAPQFSPRGMFRPGWLVFVVGGAWHRQSSPAGHKPHSAPISAPCGAFQCTGGKLYSYSPERRTAPCRGLSARVGTPKEGFCNTTHAGISGHDNAHGFYYTLTRGEFAPFIWNVIRLLPKAHS